MAITPVSNTPITPQNTATETSIALKTGVAVTSALGVAASVALIAKRQGFSLNPTKIANTKVKDWAIFKITNPDKPNEKIMKFGWKEIMGMGLGSVTGGLIGGAIFDKKENFTSKCSEAISQLLGDITIPLSFVALPTMLYKKFEDLATKETPHAKLQSLSKAVQNNKFLKIACPTIISGSSLVTGIIAGNKVSNHINSQLHGEDRSRGIRLTDFAPHLDDVCLAITLMADKSPVGDIISKFVPIALSVAGYETGTTQKPEKSKS